ncbi:MAG: carbohydrate ABC transporter permease [Chloroflexi bacterium]|nr:carbohydrate ABC transporter permease [Chloroflexota bacterium]
MSVSRSTLLTYAVLLAAAAITLLPFLWIFVTSLKYIRDVSTGAMLFQPTLSNYESLFSGDSPFPRYMLNSLIVALLATTTAVLVGVPAAYSLTRFRWPALVSGGLLGWILVMHAIPPVTLSAPLFVVVRSLGLYDQLVGLALIHILLAVPIVVWLMRGFFGDLPQEVEEAARVDGCSRVQVFTLVALPLVAPGIAAAGMLAFMVSWNEFLFAVTLTSSAQAQTIPVGLSLQVQEYVIRYGEMSAGAVIATVPAILFVALGQRRLVQGLTFGAVKG